MNTMTADAKFWDRIAPKYSTQPIGDEAAYEKTLERTLSHLAPDASVLELGCGTGSTALRLAPHLGDYRATDISGGMISIAEGKPVPEGAEISFAVEGVNGPAPDEPPYDAVLAFNLLHLVKDLEGDLAKIRARLDRGGLFISKSPCLGEAWFIKAMVWPMQLVGKAPKTVLHFTRDELEAAIQWAGFEIVESGDYPAKTPPAHFVVARAI